MPASCFPDSEISRFPDCEGVTCASFLLPRFLDSQIPSTHTSSRSADYPEIPAEIQAAMLVGFVKIRRVAVLINLQAYEL